ncbi:MAG: ribosome silencing factor [Gammaproteobacteria bacterium]
MQTDELKDLMLQAVEDMKAVNVRVLDVREKTSVTDILIVVSGTSSRHVKSIAGNVVDEAKAHDVVPMGVEGEDGAEWVLVDLGDVVVHVMLPAVREFYQLERLWEAPDGDSVSESSLHH